jgi:hypothetical protein
VARRDMPARAMAPGFGPGGRSPGVEAARWPHQRRRDCALTCALTPVLGDAGPSRQLMASSGFIAIRWRSRHSAAAAGTVRTGRQGICKQRVAGSSPAAGSPSPQRCRRLPGALPPCPPVAGHSYRHPHQHPPSVPGRRWPGRRTAAATTPQSSRHMAWCTGQAGLDDLNGQHTDPDAAQILNYVEETGECMGFGTLRVAQNETGQRSCTLRAARACRPLSPLAGRRGAHRRPVATGQW